MSALELAPRVRRVRAMTRTNVRLLLRNRLASVYAFVIPLTTLALLWTQSSDLGPESGLNTVATALSMALLFPVYYNLLSVVVTRRDELVLKRLRTGEARDAEILLSLLLPGVAIAMAVCALAMVVTPLAGFPAPANPVLMLAAMLVACGAFAGLALWTAAWTRNAEAAQLTSAPVIVLTVAGLLRPLFPESVREWAALLPGAAVEDLVRAAWFGLAEDGSAASLLDGSVATLPPLLALTAWTVLGVSMAMRRMPWEPRP